MKWKGGTFPYGKHPLRPDEKEVLAWMIESKKNGATITEIMMELNRREIPSRRSRVWHINTVARILRRNVP